MGRGRDLGKVGLLLGALLATGVATGCSQGGNESVVEVTGTEPAKPSSSGDGGEGNSDDGDGNGDDGGGLPDRALDGRPDGKPDVVGTVATGLSTPWGVAFLPDGRAVVTERDTARVLLLTLPEEEGGAVQVEHIGTIPEVAPQGEAGLLGVAVSPDFDSDGLLYFYVCTAEDNRVVRVPFADGDEPTLGEVEPILTGIPNGVIHDGGRLAFGPDGYLYVTTGETGDSELARDRSSYAGKILRITADGEPAPDNPFDDEVWSWGHRNVEGITWDVDGNLWAAEFGDSSADELNRIEPGADYGWPVVEGSGGPEEYAEPALTWPVEDASPAGIAFVGGRLWMAGLRGERLWRITVRDGEASDPTPYLWTEEGGDYGRLRTVVLAPDGNLWLTTSNTDGRGEPREGDDRILVLEP